MAIQNHPSLYSGGSVVFNQQPHVQLYATLKAREQAREEAFDEYTRNLRKGINTAGMRNQDRPAFDKKYQDWQKFYLDNRDKIRGRKEGADIKFQQGWQELMDLAEESKATEAGKKPLVEILTDPNKRDRLSEDILPMIQSHDAPLYITKPDGTVERNPNWKAFDVSKLNFDPKPFESDKFFKGLEDVKRMDLPPVIEKDPITMTQKVTTTSVFDQEAKEVIATRAVTELANNRSFRDTIKKLKPEDYNAVFRANYGRDIEDDGDLAAAYTLKGMQQKIVSSKIEPDTFGRQQAMEGIRNANARSRIALQDSYAKGRIDYRKAASKEEQKGSVENWIKKAYDEGESSKGATYVNGVAVPARQIAVPATMIKKYTIKGGEKGTSNVQPTKFFITEDGKYVVPSYPGISSKGRRDHIPIETFKNEVAQSWLPKKQAASVIEDEVDIDFGDDDEVEESVQMSTPQGKTHPLPAGKPRTVKQGNYTYTWNEQTGQYE